MSEAILEALMKLFGLIAKQDAGVGDDERNYVRTFLQSQIGEQEVGLYLRKFDENAEVRLDEDGHVIKNENSGDVKASESVKIIGTCRKISKELEKDEVLSDGTKITKDPEVVKKQKAVIFVRIYEMLRVSVSKAPDMVVTGRMEVIDGVVLAFKLNKEEVQAIKAFSMENDADKMDYKGILIADERENVSYTNALHIQTGKLKGAIFFLYMASVDLYFVRYSGGESYVNGNLLAQDCVSPFPTRSIIKATSATMCFFDVEAKFSPDRHFDKISYEVNDMSFRFKNGTLGLRHINMAEREGSLIGIMGASGAGKTTLLNVLCGNEAPSEGEVLINGRNLHTQPELLEGVIGLIPQDDLLIEELTVYENLYYSAKLCFKNKSEKEIKELVNRTLDNLGLFERKDLVVGSPLNKSISGGQRKRLNIALELIREPAVLFVDEPTSGLSSGDSENVINLLRELAVKNGKLVFVVIHQPSSDIYKMFDKMFILDTGGYPVYYGDPVGAITYTKHQIGQASNQGACGECGNVNTELVFNVLEAKVIDEWGGTSNKRKVLPESWNKKYQENIVLPKVERVEEEPPRSLDLPSWIGQFWIYTRRDFWAKISNTQYILMNILEAPLLGFMLAYLVRYIVDPNSDIYIFRENENIPVYIFMAIIVSIFFGLIVSAEEIFKDAKIMKRERFLNLSRSAYLMSKILILMGLSAIQMILFILVGNFVIGFRGMNTEFFLMLFTVSVSSNILGLIISSAFNTIVTIYIMIPLIMIPQMVLGGAMFTFDKLNKTIASVDKVPFVAEFIPARYAYEGLIVYQYEHNPFKEQLFETEMRESMADFKQVYYLPELTNAIERVKNYYEKGKTDDENYINDLALLHNELGKESLKRQPQIEFEALDKLNKDDFNMSVYNQTKEYIDQLLQVYSEIFLQANTKREKTTQYLLENQYDKYVQLKDAYYNETVSEVVRKTFDKNKILRDGDKLIQIVDPIYQLPEPEGILSFRSHFFAPKKYFCGRYWDTLWFNMASIWVLTIFLYIVLYYDWAHRCFEYMGQHIATPFAAKMDELNKKRAAAKKAKHDAAVKAAAEKAEKEKKAAEEVEKKAKEEAAKRAKEEAAQKVATEKIEKNSTDNN